MKSIILIDVKCNCFIKKVKQHNILKKKLRSYFSNQLFLNQFVFLYVFVIMLLFHDSNGELYIFIQTNVIITIIVFLMIEKLLIFISLVMLDKTKDMALLFPQLFFIK